VSALASLDLKICCHLAKDNFYRFIEAVWILIMIIKMIFVYLVAEMKGNKRTNINPTSKYKKVATNVHCNDILV
jgi:hypothetical protein